MSGFPRPCCWWRSDRVKRVRRGAAGAVPTRVGADAVSAFWFERLATVISDHFLSADADEIVAADSALRRPWRGLAAGHAGAPHERPCRSSASCAATSPARPGPSTSSPARSGRAAPARTGRERANRPAHLLARHQGRRGPRRERDLHARRQSAGAALAEHLKHASLSLYERVAATRRRAGSSSPIQFEFGTTPDGRLLVIDEILTPDSSRFWPADRYAPSEPAQLRQAALRDYLAGLKQEGQWDGNATTAAAAAGGRAGDGRAVPKGLSTNHGKPLGMRD